MATSIPTGQRNRMADAICARANNGTLRIYGGTAPASADAALSGNTLLASLGMGATAFGAAASGTATANAISDDTSADATGTASFYRVVENDGTTVVWQGDAGVSGSGASLILSSVSIYATGNVSVSSLTFTQPAS